MKAKSFKLADQTGRPRSLSEFRGSFLVLYFYPRDFTSGCTREAEGFRDAAAAFQQLGAVVVGVSKDSCESHAKFDAKHSLGFVLLTDPDLTVTKMFGAFGTKNTYGKTVEGVKRSTCLVGPDGTVLKEWKSVKVPGHVEQVLAELYHARLQSVRSSG
ncbi:MAG: peroxiredoxin [Polyangiaceae bacterium]|jgi:peroxiredoxin Q/BCP|nr:peroxiredoxin [Polyangiaceae bacterium]